MGGEMDLEQALILPGKSRCSTFIPLGAWCRKAEQSFQTNPHEEGLFRVDATDQFYNYFPSSNIPIKTDLTLRQRCDGAASVIINLISMIIIINTTLLSLDILAAYEIIPNISIVPVIVTYFS
ncbi:hypothetical protein RP20_CCG001932 [Aedes albopictus]|nr:hypothetical protein RP20_CCG001932 [Aedes albopictus]